MYLNKMDYNVYKKILIQYNTVKSEIENINKRLDKMEVKLDDKKKFIEPSETIIRQKSYDNLI